MLVIREPCPSFHSKTMNTFRVLVADEALLRAMEKEQIRREIITGEILRRRQLEEEVRRELAVEEAFRISMQRHLPTPNSFQEQLNPSLVEQSIIGQEIKPSSSSSSSSSSSQINKDRVIILPRPGPDLHSSKRKAVTPAETEPSTFGVSKKAKKEWRCELCQVDATSESQLNSHQSGKKHKAKEAAALRKMDKSTETSLLSKENVEGVKTTETSLLSKENVKGVKTTETLGDINGTVVDNGVMVDDSIGASQLQLPQIVTPVEIKPSPQIDMDKAITLAKCDPDIHNAKGKAVAMAPAVNTTRSTEVNLMKKPMEKWNCAICGIYTTSKWNLSDHLNSKKHKAKEAALRNQEVLKTAEAYMSLKESEKSTKAAEIILTASPTLDPKVLVQFPQPSLTSEELNDTTVVSFNSSDVSKKHKAKEAVLRNQEVLKTPEASMSLEESEKSVKAAEIILIASPTLDPEVLAQFPQPLLSSEELEDTTVDRAEVESDGKK